MLSNRAHEEFLARRARMSGAVSKVITNRIPHYRNQVPDELIRPIVRRPTYDMLLDAVCAEMGVSEDQVLGTERKYICVNARHVLFYVIRVTQPVSYLVLARRFNRDHTTILHGVTRVQKKMRDDPFFSQLVSRCLSRAHLAMGHAYWGA
jgi:chromosomal replication initiation ATPase DnaA